MNKATSRVMEVINVLDTAGVYSITSKMVCDYFQNNKCELTSSIVDRCIEELAASDFIVWDATKSYFRPVRY